MRTGLTDDGDRIRVSVRDNGPGVPPEIESRIFDPFFTTKEPGEGTGLGLSISRQIIERHKGQIWLENQSGEGATFVLDLPVSQRAQPAEGDDPDECAGRSGSPPARILVVDDEKSIGHLLVKILSRQGHQVDVVLNGSKAIHQLEEKHYDIVFLDLRIPGLSGQAVYAWIKKDRADLCERTVILTGDTLSDDTMGFLKQEDVPHLLKPFQVADVRRAMKLVWPY
jgi:CheY-like chemotaxis protein